MDPSVKIKNVRESNQTERKPVAVSLGCHVKGVALPHVDPGDARTMLDGVRKRFACQMPGRNKELLDELREFVKRKIPKMFKPLSPTSDVSVETWLESTKYPLWRKKQLIDCWKRAQDPNDPKYSEVKSFIKDETYVDWKHARGINSRDDVKKCQIGPIFRLIEKEVFKLPNFIKKVPVRDRPQYLIDRHYKPGLRYAGTDFSQFEAHFDRELMEAIEFQLYEYMVSELPAGPEWMRIVREVISGVNKCVYKFFTLFIEARRMSGEMNTSLGNGFANLMLLLFMFHKMGEEVDPTVEGDDGITGFSGKVPDKNLISDLGLCLKMDVYEELTHASFCGMVFDFKARNIITNPSTELAAFGWTTSQYAKSSVNRHKALLRAKAFSMAYQYPGCPILWKLAQYGLRVTEGLKAKPSRMNEYEREQFLEMISFVNDNKLKGLPEIPIIEPSIATRQLVEKLYGITIDAQLRIEEYLDNKTEISPLDHGQIHTIMSRTWEVYFQNYTYKGPVPRSDIFPPFVHVVY